MNISNTIAKLIMDMLEADGCAEMQRNELAQTVGCVPSQINYVRATRFSPEHGYIVESRRGGNGYIRISRVRMDRQTLLMHVINSLGSELDYASARAILTNLAESGAVSVEAANCMLSAVSQRALQSVPQAYRGVLRSDIIKHVLIQLV